MELITDSGFEDGSGDEFSESWVTQGGNVLQTTREPVEGRGYAARFRSGRDTFIEQTLSEPGYATGDLSFWIIKVPGRELYGIELGFEFTVELYYEGRQSPDIEQLGASRYGFLLPEAEHIYSRLVTVATRRCSRLTKIKIINQTGIVDPYIDDVSIEGEANIPQGYWCYLPLPYPPMNVPHFHLDEPPYHFFWPPGSFGPPYPLGFSEMPNKPTESIFSEIEYRLRKIEMQLKNIQHIEYESQKIEKPISKQKDEGKHKAE